MNSEQHSVAEEFIGSLGLAMERVMRRERHNRYEHYGSDGSKPMRFGHVRLDIGGTHAGKMIVYVNGDFSDPLNRFTSQPCNPRVAWYKFWPDEDLAMKYASSALLSESEQDVAQKHRRWLNGR